LRFKKPDLHQRMMKNYYRLISEVDYASGKIVEELEKQGILDETLVIFTTDNGYFHSEHGFGEYDDFYVLLLFLFLCRVEMDSLFPSHTSIHHSWQVVPSSGEHSGSASDS
jgi:arylsulfatase A-like enzyme